MHLQEGGVRIIVLGATGLIGSAVSARLGADGHDVVGLSRSRGSPGLTAVRHMIFDIAGATTAEQWFAILSGVDAVVNCAGVLQDSPSDSTRGVHADGVAALFEACERQGVRRIVHLSAAGVDRGSSAFSQTKQAGDAALMARDLDWFILRPSVVIGRGAYGGSALLRGLAALPVRPVLPGTGPLQLVHLDDVVETVCVCLRGETPTGHILELVGRRRWSFDEAAQLFRRWLRWPAAPAVTVPSFMAGLLYRTGDALSWLGWRPPVRTTAQREIVHGATGDAGRWRQLTGIVPRDIEHALASEPASVQERWFAQLYLLKPLVFGVFGLFWISTGIVSLGPGWNDGLNLMREGGARETLAILTVVAGGLADIVIGLAILYRPTSRLGLYAALAISIIYMIIGTLLLPRLWADPLGSMLKVWPIMVLTLVALAIREDR